MHSLNKLTIIFSQIMNTIVTVINTDWHITEQNTLLTINYYIPV